MSEFNYKITEQVYNWIIEGTKSIEIRLYNEKSSKIKINDIINFKVVDNESKKIKVKVLELTIYKNIKELLKEVNIKYISNTNEKELERILYNIYGEEKVKKHNILAIKFKIIGDINE